MVRPAEVPHDPAVIARLQRQASRNSGAYRLRLAILAVVGDIVLTIALALPWAAPIVFGVLLINLKLFYWLGAAAIVFLTWLQRPMFRFQGRELKADEASQLYRDVAVLRQKLDVRARMRVYLDESFNASA